jgi:hypothetical protein
MDTETLATITAAAGTVKPILEAIRAALSGAKGREAEKKAQEALGLVPNLQARILQLQEIALRLGRELSESQEKNHQLSEQIRQKEEWTAERERYEYKTGGNTVTLVSKENPHMRICVACFEDKKKAIPLHKHPANNRWRFCPLCKTTIAG